MHRLRVVMTKELRVLMRDKHAVAVLFLMPMVFIFFLSLALQDLFLDKVGRRLTITVIDEDSGRPLVGELRTRLAAAGFAAGAKGSVSAEVTVPQGMSQAFDQLLAGQAASGGLGVKLVITSDPALDPGYRAAIKGAVLRVMYDLLLHRLGEVLAPTAAGAALKPFLERPLDGDAMITEAVRGQGELKVQPNPLQQNVPGWSVFAMFFIATPLAGGLLRERADGTMRRLFTLPVHRGWIVAGKLVPYLVINMIQFGLMLLVGLFVVPAVSELHFNLGDHPWLLLPVTLVAALAATGFGILVACLARSVEHATALTAGFVITAGVIGGIMVPVFAMPPFMQVMAKASPLFWAHQAYLDVLVRGSDFTAVAPGLVALAAFGAGCLAIGVARFRWL